MGDASLSDQRQATGGRSTRGLLREVRLKGGIFRVEDHHRGPVSGEPWELLAPARRAGEELTLGDVRELELGDLEERSFGDDPEDEEEVSGDEPGQPGPP